MAERQAHAAEIARIRAYYEALIASLGRTEGRGP
jgi:hypothetical protein